MPSNPSNLNQRIEPQRYIKSYMQIGGVDRTWGAYIIQHLNLCNFQTDLEYPDLYSFHRELK